MAPHLPQNLIGARPSEKLHEILCPADNSHLTLEFSEHYVMQPSIKFHDRGYDYLKNRLGVTGAPVARGFEYTPVQIPSVTLCNKFGNFMNGPRHDSLWSAGHL
jgi:hypothetical protein